MLIYCIVKFALYEFWFHFNILVKILCLYTNKISIVHFGDQLWIDSDDLSLEKELIGHQNQSKPISKMNFGNFICKWTFNTNNTYEIKPSKYFSIKYW